MCLLINNVFVVKKRIYSWDFYTSVLREAEIILKKAKLYKFEWFNNKIWIRTTDTDTITVFLFYNYPLPLTIKTQTRSARIKYGV